MKTYIQPDTEVITLNILPLMDGTSMGTPSDDTVDGGDLLAPKFQFLDEDDEEEVVY